MKPFLMFFLQVLSAVLLLSGTWSAMGQSSVVWRYSALEGDSVLMRSDNSMLVTCCNTGGLHSCFVVDDGTTRFRFFTTQAPSNPYIYTLDSGYVVKDMQLEDGVCWFAGYKWRETGQILYDLEGHSYAEIVYNAFVGRFNPSDVLNGNGNYGIINVDGIRCIDRLAVIGNNVTALGRTPAGERRLVELKRFISSIYFLKVEKSTMQEEVFRDVVAAGDKVVVLSRFTMPGSFWRSKYCFGLRYGSAGNMINTSSTIHSYDVYDIDLWHLAFTNESSERLAATNNGNGVVVAYLARNDENTNPMLGKFVLLHVTSENVSMVDMVINSDNEQYTELVDIRFNKPVTSNTYMAMLLRDGSPNSILRFPFLNFPYPLTEDILTMSNPVVESVAPYQTGNTGLELAAAGHFTGSTHYMAQIKEEGIYSHTGTFYSQNCFSINNGYLELSNNLDIKETDIDSALHVELSKTVVFTNHAYTAASVSRTITCSEGNQ